MRINLELKHYCPDFRQIRLLLKQIGAKKVTTKQQKDFFFHLPPHHGVVPRMKLRIEKGKQTLIYYRRPNFSKQRGVPAELMLYSVADKKLLPFLVKALGQKSVVQKKRELWRKGNTVFHLDTVSGVGNVFEVEVQGNPKITERDRKYFRDYSRLLTPYLGKIIKGSNGDLLARG